MELENFSTNELKNLLIEKQNEVERIKLRLEFFDREIENMNEEIENLNEEISDSEVNLEELELEIEEVEAKIEDHLNQFGCLYSYSELEDSGQRVLFND